MITIIGSENAFTIILGSEAVRNKLLSRLHSFLRVSPACFNIYDKDIYFITSLHLKVYKSPPIEKLVMPAPGVESGLRTMGAGGSQTEGWTDVASSITARSSVR
jgi:hypothetical protein